MSNKRISIAALLLLILSLALCACAYANESADAPAEETSVFQQIYIDVFESYFEHDAALHQDITYLAIDLDTLQHATDADKQAIVAHFAEKLHVEVRDASYEELNAQESPDQPGIGNGLLLSIEAVALGSSRIQITGEKYRGPLGANGFESILKQSGDVWELSKTEMTWIS